MARGGARPGSGPAPDLGSLREAVRVEAGLIRTLPVARPGQAPAWPLPTRASAAERKLWVELWRKPQAIVWEEQGVERVVARYVRLAIEVESGDVPAAKVKLVIEHERILMLELGSLLKAGFRITSNAPKSVAVSAEVPPSKRAAVPSSRGRLRLVTDGDST